MQTQPRTPLRGRNQEVDAVRRRLEETRAGTGSVVVIEGSPGLGKTRLIAECAAVARGMSFQVGRGTTERGRAVDELHALFDALFDGHPPLADRQAMSDLHALPEFLFWLLQEVQAVIEEVAFRAPVLLCLDDLQWAGATCAVAMRQLPQRLAALPVVWVMAFRPNQGVPEIQQAQAALIEGGAEHIRLGPLEREAVAQVAADTLGVEADDELLSKAARVQGNPFLLVEFFRGLLDDHLVSFDSGRASLVEDRLPRRVGISMRRRLSLMDPTAERVATLACGLGRRFTLHDLATLTDISVPGLLPPVNDLLQADIFADEDSYLTFRHDLIRDAVRGSLSAPVCRAVDRHAADVLISRGALPTEVAIQLAESAQPGDSVAIETILKAAQVLSNSDPGGAAELAGRALDLAPRRHPLRGPLVACRAVCLFAAGRVEEAKRFADSALRQVLPAEEQARVRFGVSSMFDLSPVVRAENARAGLALPSLPDELRASLWVSLYHSLSVAGYTEGALEVRAEANNTVPGTGLSPDKMLLARGFYYADAHRARPGVNYQQIPVNRPRSPVRSYAKDGVMRIDPAADPVYYPNSIPGAPAADASTYAEQAVWAADGEMVRSAYTLHAEDDDYGQANTLINQVMDDSQRERLVSNVAGALSSVKRPEVLDRAFEYWRNIDKTIGDRIQAATAASNPTVQAGSALLRSRPK